MDGRKHFTGYSLNAVDGKGRVSLPADFRAAVERRVGQPAAGTTPDRYIYVGEHETLECLVGYDEAYVTAMSDAIDRRVATLGDDADTLREAERLSAGFGAAASVSYDEAGRMVLPIVRKLVGIDGQAFFLGRRDLFQIWSPDTYLAAPDVDARSKRALELMLKEKKAARE